jgi:hypothetical membrane protein
MAHYNSVFSNTRADALRIQTTIRLLACGVIGGSVFVAANIVQVLTREGFEVKRHALSLLTLGDLGWIQTIAFVASGLLAIACAIGMRRALQPGRADTSGPVLIGMYGVALVAAGIFHPDPALGFPPGTPAKTPVGMSWHAALHTLTFFVLLLALVAACVEFMRRFASSHQIGWAAYCLATAVAIPVLIVGGIARPALAAPLSAVAGCLTWLWIAAVAAGLLVQHGVTHHS